MLSRIKSILKFIKNIFVGRKCIVCGDALERWNPSTSHLECFQVTRG